MKPYKQVEGMLYSHFERKKRQERYCSLLIRTRDRIKEIEDDLVNCNISLNGDIQGIDYDKEIVSSSESNASVMEQELIREETKLEEELQRERRYKHKLKRRVRNIQKQVDDIEVILEQLPVNYVKFIELLYKDKLTYRKAGYILHCEPSTVGRNKNDIIEELRRIL